MAEVDGKTLALRLLGGHIFNKARDLTVNLPRMSFEVQVEPWAAARPLEARGVRVRGFAIPDDEMSNLCFVEDRVCLEEEELE